MVPKKRSVTQCSFKLRAYCKMEASEEIPIKSCESMWVGMYAFEIPCLGYSLSLIFTGKKTVQFSKEHTALHHFCIYLKKTFWWVHIFNVFNVHPPTNK